MVGYSRKTRKKRRSMMPVIFIAVLVVCAVATALLLWHWGGDSVGIHAGELTNDVRVNRVNEGMIYGYRSMTVMNGDTIETGADSSVKLEFDDGQLVTFGENSEAEFGWNGSYVTIYLRKGTLIAAVGYDGSKYAINISTPKTALGMERGVFVTKVVPVTAIQAAELTINNEQSANTKMYALSGDITCRLYDINGKESGETKVIAEGRCQNIVSDVKKADYCGALYYVRGRGFDYQTLDLLYNMSLEYTMCISTGDIMDALLLKLTEPNETIITFVTTPGEPIEDQTYVTGAVELPDAKADGYIFDGWYTDSECTQPVDTESLDGEVVLYAGWTPAVKFTLKGGDEVETYYAAAGKVVGELPVPASEKGGEFTGWFLNNAYTRPFDPTTAVAAADMTLYARFGGSGGNNVTLTFDSTGGSEVAEVEYPYGTRPASPEAPVRDGFTFAGWYADAAYKAAYSFPGSILTRDTTVYAKWKPNPGTETVDASFDANDGDNGAGIVYIETVIKGDKLTAPTETPVWDGHTFAGWARNSGGTVLWDFSDTVSESMTLYASWDAIPQLVRFDTLGGSAVADMEVDFGKTISPAPENPTKDGYAFTGWYTDKETTKAWNMEKNSVTAPTLLYAGWSGDVYTISFETNGGEKLEPVKAGYGATVIGVSPVKAGSTFAGWYRDPELTVKWNDGVDKLTSDTTLYAAWTLVPYVFTYSAGDGGSITGTLRQEVLPGAGGDMVTAVASDGYHFVSWSDGNTNASRQDKSAVSDLTVSAKFEINVYTLTFLYEDGTPVSDPVQAVYNGKAKPPTPKTPDGMTFAGWFTAPKGGYEVAEFSAIKENMTLYARFTAAATATATTTATAAPENR